MSAPAPLVKLVGIFNINVEPDFVPVVIFTETICTVPADGDTIVISSSFKVALVSTTGTGI